MTFIGAFLIFFGVSVILFPELIAIIIGVFFIAIGINVLAFSFRIQQVQKNASENQNRVFTIGNYEFIRKK